MKKEAAHNIIKKVYRQEREIPGHRMMKKLIEKEGIYISKTTAHRYMNKELKLYSIVKRKNENTRKGTANEVFPNLLNQNFKVEKRNTVWCTDFTYIYYKDSRRYNSTIIDLYDRSVIASVNGKDITAELAIRTLEKAMKAHKIKKGIILHSDQGSQYTSKVFNEYCEAKGIRQSMSRAGYPYDNAVMERYFNSMKNEVTHHHKYENEKELDEAIREYAYEWYNHKRPHTYNENLTPFEARYTKVDS